MSWSVDGPERVPGLRAACDSVARVILGASPEVDRRDVGDLASLLFQLADKIAPGPSRHEVNMMIEGLFNKQVRLDAQEAALREVRKNALESVRRIDDEGLRSLPSELAHELRESLDATAKGCSSALGEVTCPCCDGEGEVEDGVDGTLQGVRTLRCGMCRGAAFVRACPVCGGAGWAHVVRSPGEAPEDVECGPCGGSGTAEGTTHSVEVVGAGARGVSEPSVEEARALVANWRRERFRVGDVWVWTGDGQRLKRWRLRIDVVGAATGRADFLALGVYLDGSPEDSTATDGREARACPASKVGKRGVIMEGEYARGEWFSEPGSK